MFLGLLIGCFLCNSAVSANDIDKEMIDNHIYSSVTPISDISTPEGTDTYYHNVSGGIATYSSFGKNTLSKLIREMRMLGSGDEGVMIPIVRDLGRLFPTFEQAWNFFTNNTPISTYNQVATELEYLYRQGVYVVTVTINGRDYSVKKGL